MRPSVVLKVITHGRPVVFWNEIICFCRTKCRLIWVEYYKKHATIISNQDLGYRLYSAWLSLWERQEEVFDCLIKPIT